MGRSFKRLIRFLDLEQKQLIRGDLDQVIARSEQRVVHIQNWAAEQPDQTEIALVQTKLERNQALMIAAKNGIRSAMHNFAEIRTLASNFATYSPAQGRVLKPVAHQCRLNRKS